MLIRARYIIVFVMFGCVGNSSLLATVHVDTPQDIMRNRCDSTLVDDRWHQSGMFFAWLVFLGVSILMNLLRVYFLSRKPTPSFWAELAQTGPGRATFALISLFWSGIVCGFVALNNTSVAIFLTVIVVLSLVLFVLCCTMNPIEKHFKVWYDTAMNRSTI